ncbi:MAG: ABC transporter permease [Desulfurococcaceae archaeon]
MYKLIRRAYAVFKAYFLSDIIRSKGLIYGLISLSLWLMIFLMPMSLFIGEEQDPGVVANYGFTAILIFMLYSIATWDFAAELRFLINQGILEYYLSTNSGILPHYMGLIPVSLMWLLLALSINYVVLSIVFNPPLLVIHNSLCLVLGLTMLFIVLISYALILGGSLISSGSSGFILEILGFILPIATGGLTPLSRLPELFRIFALYTPFSYPAEVIRYSILGFEPVMSIEKMLLIGYVYSIIFLIVSILYFKYQLKKILKEGVRVTTLW